MTTKTKLIWRLGSRPTVDEVRELLKEKVITKDEAREILFSLETEEDKDVEALEAEIKFLRQLVEKLSTSRTEIVERIRDVYIPYKKYDWYKPYDVWCSTANAIGGSYTTGTTSNQLMMSTSGSNNLKLSAVQASASPAASFSSIKTF